MSLSPLLFEIGLVLQTLDVGENFIEGFDDHSGDAAGIVQLPQQLEVFEVFRGLELAPEPRAESSLTGEKEIHVMCDQPERPLGDGTAHGLGSGAGMILRVQRLAHVVQQGRQQKLLIIGPRLARQVKDLKAVIEDVTLGMELRVLLDGFQGNQAHPVDGEPVEVLGQCNHAFALRGLGHRRLLAGIVLTTTRPPESHELVANLAVGGQVSRPHAVPEHRRGLTLCHIKIVLASTIKPVQRARRPKISGRVQQAPRRLECDLLPEPLRRGREAILLAKLVVHHYLQPPDRFYMVRRPLGMQTHPPGARATLGNDQSSGTRVPGSQMTSVIVSKTPRRANSVRMPASASLSIARTASTTSAIRQCRASRPWTAAATQ